MSVARENESTWLKIALALAQAGAWEWEVATGEIRWSEGLRRLYGIDGPGAQSTYASWLESIHPEDRPAIDRTVGDSVANCREIQAEFRVNSAGGEERWLLSRGQPIPGADGRPERYLGILLDITESKRGNQALRDNETRYRTLVDQAMPDALFVHDHDGRFIEVNRHACACSGYDREELLGMNVFDLEVGLDPEAIRDAWNSMRPGAAAMFHGRQRRKDGTSYPTEVHLGVMTLEGGRLYVATVRDIGERLGAEENMRLLSAAVEQSTSGVIITDAARRILFVNDAFRAISGFSPEEVVGRPANILGSGETPDETYRDLDAALSAGRPWTGEFHNRRRDGGIGIDLSHIAPVRDAAGRITHYVGVQEDVTEKRRMAMELEIHHGHLEKLVAARTAELAAAESRLRLIIDSSADGIVELDRKGAVVLANPAACEMLGYRPEDLLGRNLHDAIHYLRPDHTPYPANECEIIRAVSQGRGLRLDADVFWRADGAPLPVSVASQPIFIENRPMGAVVTFSDATERQRVEAEREKTRAEAERLARVKSEFLANMSHEIRTPLNGVLGLAQIGYRDSAGRDKTRDTFARILDSGKLLHTIINDILDFSKIEAGKLAVESIPLDPARLVDEAVRSLATAATAKKLSLVGEMAADLPPVCLGDPVRIAQVLLNLLSNAVKFTHSGEVRLSARVEDAELLYRVSDTGIGIAREDMERLFLPFEQADGGTTRQYGGTGLGLAISRRLANLMGGRLSVSSEVGKGSAFELRLPMRLSDQPAVAATSTGIDTKPRLRDLRLLVAEDNEINRLVLEDMLQGEGAEAVMVENGKLAVEAVAREGAGFHAVLMDVQMPVMDGLDATRELGRLAPDLPVIGQTAHALPEEHARCRIAGMVATLTKPIDIDALVGAVLAHVRQRSPDRAWEAMALAESARSARDVIDWASLNHRFQHRQAFVERLTRLAVETHAGTPAHLRELARAGDLAGIAATAHSLKAVAGNLSAMEVESQAIQTLYAARAGDKSAARMAEALADAMERLVDCLLRGPEDAA